MAIDGLVTWGGPDYRDTGEGGLFAYAVFDVPQENCNVDVHPDLGPADVMVAAHGPMAEDFDEQSHDFDRLAGHPDVDIEDAYRRTTDSVGAVIPLGSTGESWFSEEIGNYFSVTSDALAERGRVLIETLEDVYGPATFVTYLDT